MVASGFILVALIRAKWIRSPRAMAVAILLTGALFLVAGFELRSGYVYGLMAGAVVVSLALAFWPHENFLRTLVKRRKKPAEEDRTEGD